MKKQLYQVTITMMVMAEDRHEATYEARRADIDDCDVDIVKSLSYPAHWANAIPFGSNDGKTCKELFPSLKPK